MEQQDLKLRKSKGPQKEMVTAVPLRKFIDDTGMTYAEVGQRLGVVGSTISHWVNKNRMPKLAGLALAHIMAPKRSPQPSEPILLMIKTTHEDAEAASAILEKLGYKPKAIGL